MTELVVSIIALIILMFALPLIGVLLGAFSGWLVGIWWSEPILGFLARFGVDTVGMELWQVGAALGFIGAFFKASQTNNAK